LKPNCRAKRFSVDRVHQIIQPGLVRPDARGRKTRMMSAAAHNFSQIGGGLGSPSGTGHGIEQNQNLHRNRGMIIRRAPHAFEQPTILP